MAVVVFVIRYYGGRHIGHKRFEIHQKLLKKAISDFEKDVFFTSKLTLNQELLPSPKRTKPRSRIYKTSKTSALQPCALDFGAPRMQQPTKGTRFESYAYQQYALQLQQSTADDSADSYISASQPNLTCSKQAWGDTEAPVEQW